MPGSCTPLSHTRPGSMALRTCVSQESARHRHAVEQTATHHRYILNNIDRHHPSTGPHRTVPRKGSQQNMHRGGHQHQQAVVTKAYGRLI
ncbi:hypothetical protein BU26DRAFT_286661 [Trematosphaeria pertusa]|uniref:Uncharacterized protein n=1 Tax=Trematosphaeria pertusa TaxID=390896 RepID=A0A6A6IHC7_9PLEO|nr:uncharacterized protein BU26DRAFT_286661 [Trematosphaeria pertusa]KAF2249609.1 hypothetical protein BU26DRAFT_286661 [Trematosphaeria pertusa]